jgi:ubiquinone/menaquinone biosynthesis C-methylase UbiE
MPNDNPGFERSITETYHRHLVPLIFDDYARDLAGRMHVPEGGRVLEIACGTGALTRHLRTRLPAGASLVATDLSPAMLDAARENLGDPQDITFRVADGTALPFADGSFDTVVCQFGVMFYPDKGAGYREALRVLKPGGTFLFNVWDSHAANRFAGRVHETVVAMFPDDPPAFLAAPFSYHDIGAISNTLEQAGFSSIRVDVLPRESRAASARDVAVAMVEGSPLASQFDSASARRAALDEVAAALRATFGDGPVSAPMQSIAFAASRT